MRHGHRALSLVHRAARRADHDRRHPLRYGLFSLIDGDDALGFRTLGELGLGAEVDLSAQGYPLSRIGFMGSFFAGDRTRGWSLGITFEL